MIDGTAFLIQTLLSWNAAPPTGATASAPVSMLMPRPPIWASLRIAERDGVAIGDGERRGIGRMDHHGRRAFAGQRRRRFIKSAVEEAARRAGGEPERVCFVRLLDDGPVIGQRRHLLPRPHTGDADGRMRPIGLEVELAVRVRKAVEVMRGAKIRLDVAPQIGLQRRDIAMAALFQRRVDQFARRHFESGMHGVEAAAKGLQYFMVGAAFAGRLDQLGADRNVLVAAAIIEIVVLHEHRRGQDDVRHGRGAPAPAPPTSDWCSGSASP